MKTLSHGQIAEGSPNSFARIKVSKLVCRSCAKKYFTGPIMDMGEGKCDVCEEKTCETYMILGGMR